MRPVVTPLVDITSILGESFGVRYKGRVMAKCEFKQPSGSMKHRMVYKVLENEWMKGRRKPYVACASSGNTAVAVAMLSKVFLYTPVLILPSTTTESKIRRIEQHSVNFVLCPPTDDKTSPFHYTNVEELFAKRDDFFCIDQYSSDENPLSYQTSLGPEIVSQCNGRVERIVSVSSTGGHLMGIAKHVSMLGLKTKVFLADSTSSFTHEQKVSKGSRTEGVGNAISYPPLLDMKLIERTLHFSDEDASEASRIIRGKGFPCGASSAYSMLATKEFVNEEGTTVVVCSDATFS